MSMAVPRGGAQGAGGLGILALLLSAVGVYSVVAFTVANRTREIGIRMAMGASRELVLGSVLRDAMKLAIPGLVLGGIVGVRLAVLGGESVIRAVLGLSVAALAGRMLGLF